MMCFWIHFSFNFSYSQQNRNALHDLVPFVQFKKREHPWRSVTFSKVAGFSQQLH